MAFFPYLEDQFKNAGYIEIREDNLRETCDMLVEVFKSLAENNGN